MTAAVLAESTSGEDSSLTTLQQPRRPVVVQLAKFAVVGGLSTLLNAVLFLIFSMWWDALVANLAALVLSTVASTEGNRLFTFGGVATNHLRAHIQNSGTVLFYAFYSSAVLLVLGAFVPEASSLMQSVTVALASTLGGAARFLVLRYWVFIRR